MDHIAGDFELMVPSNDEPDPEITILVPAMNESLTVGKFVDWCVEGIAKSGRRGEILIVDSSTDQTPEIAQAHGARVLRVPARGLGFAYKTAVPYIRGRYVIMGDADCTYDFRELNPFIEALDQGADFVMGTRFRGHIEKGAMPRLHQYFGSPGTTFVLNRVLGSSLSDIHCGMRAMTLPVLQEIDIQSNGWEYASEMILKALHQKLRITEVPINFYREPEGRVSNVKRSGMLTSWKAGWATLRITFVHGADYFLKWPGLILMAIGLAGTIFLSAGPRAVGSLTLTLHAQFLFTTATILGYSSWLMSTIAKSIYDPTPATALLWQKRLPFSRVMLIISATSLIALGIDVWFLISYIQNDFKVTTAMQGQSQLALTGLLLIILAFLTFTSMLVIHALADLRTRTQRTVPDREKLLV